MNYKTILYFVVCYVLLVLLGPISFQFTGAIPITLQSLFAFVPVLLFGFNFGTALASAYLLSGALGLPVFAGYTSGIGGPATGFLVGFLLAVMYLGIVKPTSFLRVLTHVCVAHFIVIAAGFLVMYFGFSLLLGLPSLGTMVIAAVVKSAIAAWFVYFKLRANKPLV